MVLIFSSTNPCHVVEGLQSIPSDSIEEHYEYSIDLADPDFVFNEEGGEDEITDIYNEFFRITRLTIDQKSKILGNGNILIPTHQELFLAGMQMLDSFNKKYENAPLPQDVLSKIEHDSECFAGFITSIEKIMFPGNDLHHIYLNNYVDATAPLIAVNAPMERHVSAAILNLMTGNKEASQDSHANSYVIECQESQKLELLNKLLFLTEKDFALFFAQKLYWKLVELAEKSPEFLLFKQDYSLEALKEKDEYVLLEEGEVGALVKLLNEALEINIENSQNLYFAPFAKMQIIAPLAQKIIKNKPRGQGGEVSAERMIKECADNLVKIWQDSQRNNGQDFFREIDGLLNKTSDLFFLFKCFIRKCNVPLFWADNLANIKPLIDELSRQVSNKNPLRLLAEYAEEQKRIIEQEQQNPSTSLIDQIRLGYNIDTIKKTIESVDGEGVHIELKDSFNLRQNDDIAQILDLLYSNNVRFSAARAFFLLVVNNEVERLSEILNKVNKEVMGQVLSHLAVTVAQYAPYLFVDFWKNTDEKAKEKAMGHKMPDGWSLAMFVTCHTPYLFADFWKNTGEQAKEKAMEHVDLSDKSLAMFVAQYAPDSFADFWKGTDEQVKEKAMGLIDSKGGNLAIFVAQGAPHLFVDFWKNTGEQAKEKAVGHKMPDGWSLAMLVAKYNSHLFADFWENTGEQAKEKAMGLTDSQGGNLAMFVAQCAPNLFFTLWKGAGEKAKEKAMGQGGLQGRNLTMFVLQHVPDLFADFWEGTSKQAKEKVMEQMGSKGWNLAIFVTQRAPNLFTDFWKGLDEHTKKEAMEHVDLHDKSLAMLVAQYAPDSFADFWEDACKLFKKDEASFLWKKSTYCYDKANQNPLTGKQKGGSNEFTLLDYIIAFTPENLEVFLKTIGKLSNKLTSDNTIQIIDHALEKEHCKNKDVLRGLRDSISPTTSINECAAEAPSFAKGSRR